MVTKEQMARVFNAMWENFFEALKSECEDIVSMEIDDSDKGINWAKQAAHRIYEDDVKDEIGLGKGNDSDIILFVSKVIRERQIAECNLSNGLLGRASVWEDLNRVSKECLDDTMASLLQSEIDNDMYEGQIHKLMNAALWDLNFRLIREYNVAADREWKEKKDEGK